MNNVTTANQSAARPSAPCSSPSLEPLASSLALRRERLTYRKSFTGVLAACVLLLPALYSFRQSKRWPRVPDDPAMGRAFRLDQCHPVDRYLRRGLHLCQAAHRRLRHERHRRIVGLHMFPAGAPLPLPARTTLPGRCWLHGPQASALIIPADRLQGTAALGTGLILWLSAAVTVFVALQAARQPSPLPS